MSGARHPYQKRLLKEYKHIALNKLPGVTLVKNSDDLTEFIFRLKFVNHKLYDDDDLYHLRIRIGREYPVDSPQVQFIKYDVIDVDAQDTDDTPAASAPKIPVHPHVYSNGHICLNLLGADWTPACTVESVVLSVQSMLNTNEANERPPDNDSYVRYAPKNPKDTTFVFHDDKV